MRIAVAGGTGRIGSLVMEILTDRGHDGVVLTRSAGIDLMDGAGLAEALGGSAAVIDVTNAPGSDLEATRGFFGTVTRNLLQAEQDAGVGHHVVLSILAVDRVDGNAHYVGKRLQEDLARAARVPATILRTTQFHDFAEMVATWTRDGDTATLAPLLIQPVAPTDVASTLVDVATGDPQDRTIELAGPEPEDLVDMARRTFAARGETLRLIPTWRGIFGVEMAGEALLPDPDTPLAPTTFDQWLSTLT